jgi:benzoate transport
MRGHIMIDRAGLIQGASARARKPLVSFLSYAVRGTYKKGSLTMSNDPRQIINDRPMSLLQIVAVALTVGLNALDGFDVLSISFASGLISKDWQIEKAALGIVLSMELLGMAFGSIFLGGVADKIGRRKTILGCLTMMTIGMFMASRANGVYDLSFWRVLTGLGIGGMLASINAVAAEFSNQKWRSVSMALMVIGYPVGAVIGGIIVGPYLGAGDWRSIFELGGFVALAFIPLVWFFIPESIEFLAQNRPSGALGTINKTLNRFGHGQVAELPALAEESEKPSVMDVFKPGLARTTTLVTMAYSFHVVTFYFILKWVPKIVTGMGFTDREAGAVLVQANIGGAIGGAVFGLLVKQFGLKKPTLAVLLLASLSVMWFGRGQTDLESIKRIVLVTGLFTNSAIVGLYSIFALVFPTHVRATGTGFAIGAGRGFSWLAPILAGFLFEYGFGLQGVAIFMAMGSLFSAITVWMLTIEEQAPAKA